MRIQSKILLACLALASVTVILGLHNRSTQQELGQLATRIYDEAFTAVSYLRSAQNGLVRIEMGWHKQGAAYEVSLQESAINLTEILEDLDVARERAMSQEGFQAVNRVRVGLVQLKALATEGVPAAMALEAIARVEADFATAVEVYAADGFRYRQRVGITVNGAVQQAWIAVILALAIAMVITLALSQSIVPALRKAVTVAQAVAAGHLDNKIQVHGRGETAELLGALAIMQDSIALALARIQALMAEQALNHAGELAVEHTRLEAAIDNMVQGLCLFDAEGRLAIYNRRFASMFGEPEIGARPDEALPSIDLGMLQDNAHGAADAFTCDLPDSRTIAVSRQPVAGGGWVVTYEDVTERRQAESRLTHMARHDALTGLPNRTMFREHMPHALARARRGDGLAVLWLDLDRFKSVNDTLGHPVGDALLCAVAARLQQCTRETDLIARLGGDEFAIVQEGAAQPTDATALARRIIDALSTPFGIGEHHVVIGTSIGISLSDGTVADGDTLLKCADLALYRAKAEGRGNYRFFEPEMDALAQARRSLEIDLRQALAGGQMELFYQPLVDAEGAGISGFEALIRWHHPKRGLVNPALFIPLAEEIGLITAVGDWVLQTACMEAARWPGTLKVAVNLSPAQFRSGTLTHDVANALKVSGLAASRLELEITETVLLQDDESVLATLHAVRALGVRVAMDDFGTGYSSLSYLRRFPFDKIKIDQSFVSGLGEDGEAAAIVRAVAGLGRSLGMAVNAEGVETSEQLAALRGVGCGEVQGYFFSKPKPATEVADMLLEHGNATLPECRTDRQIARVGLT